MIFAVAERDGQRLAAAALAFFGRLIIRAKQRDGRRIIVQLIESQAELGDHMSHDVQHQVGDRRVEQSIETASDAIVVDLLQFARLQTQQVGRIRFGPFSEERKSVLATAGCSSPTAAGHVGWGFSAVGRPSADAFPTAPRDRSAGARG